MSDTASLNIANLQVFAETVAAADRAAGTYDSNLAMDPHYYIWQSNFQTIPMGMNGNPEQFVEQMLRALPGVNCIRIPFNLQSFNPDGSLNPQFERFLNAAASQGLQLIPVLADGDAQEFDGTSAEIVRALTGQTYDGIQQGWTMMKAWMESHPAVNAAVYGWELLNEPAAYKQAVKEASAQDSAVVEAQMVALYVKHMIELAELVSDGSDARILVSAWGYGGDTDTLANTLVSGRSAIDVLRSALGDDLVWSLHYYPGWMGTEGISDPATLQAAWEDFMAPLAGDNILMTEINAPGTTTYNPFQSNQVTTATALSLDWLKEAGVGIGWFPALQTGSSGLAMIERDGEIRYLNQPSLAAALDAFSTGMNTPANDHAEFVLPHLTAATLRNQTGDIDYPSGKLDDVDFAGFGFGYAGNDTIVGSNAANNFLYGGGGSDFIAGADNDDFLFGQKSDDFIISGDGVDHMFGGRGDDTIVGDHLNDVAYGGAGADLFVLAAHAKLTVADYSAAAQDTWMGTATGRYIGHKVLDANNDGLSDLKVTLSDGAEILFLNVSGSLGVLSVLAGFQSFSSIAVKTGAQLLTLSQAGKTLADAQLLGHLGQQLAAATSMAGTLQADSIVGGAANDTIGTSAGSDIAYGAGGRDQINGGTGCDLLFGEADADTLLGATGNDSIFGGAGQDRIHGGGGSDFLSGGFDNDRIVGAIGNDVVSGGDGDDSLFGGADTDTVSGDSGDDVIDGGLGNDSLFGGSGNDQIFAGEGNDLIEGGLGSDTAFFIGAANVTVDLTIHASQATGYGLDTLAGIENVTTGSGNDQLVGSRFANVLNGSEGNDTLLGGEGKDSLFGGTGDDLVDGGSDADMISGGLGRDRLRGGIGSDTLDGGLGSDSLTGGYGADSFVFNAKLDASNIDRIEDFKVGVDKILLESSIFTGLTEGNLSAFAFAANTTGFAADQNDRVIYETDTGNLYFDPDGSGAASRVLFGVVTSSPCLTYNDFAVI